MREEIKNKELIFQLPLWRGVEKEKKINEIFEFRLGVSKEGFMYQTTPQEIKNKVEQAYNADEYNYITKPPGASKWADSLGEYYFEVIKKFIPSIKNKNVLEIGGGSLYIGKKLLNAGVSEYIAIDPSIREISDDKRIKIRREYFVQETEVEEKINLIISLNTLEHIPNPEKILFKIRELLLKNKGQALLIFPDIEMQFKKGDYNALLHEHINYFTEGSAKNLMTICGLKIIDYIKELDTHFFLLEAEEHLPKIKESYDEKKNYEQAFTKNIKIIKKQLTEALENNEIIAFHGATNGLNNIFSILKINTDCKNIFIFDGDASKKGKYISMWPNPILYSEDKTYKQVDKVFITTLTYYYDIKKYLMEKFHFNEKQIFPCFLEDE